MQYNILWKEPAFMVSPLATRLLLFIPDTEPINLGKFNLMLS